MEFKTPEYSCMENMDANKRIYFCKKENTFQYLTAFLQFKIGKKELAVDRAEIILSLIW